MVGPLQPKRGQGSQLPSTSQDRGDSTATDTSNRLLLADDPATSHTTPPPARTAAQGPMLRERDGGATVVGGGARNSSPSWSMGPVGLPCSLAEVQLGLGC